MTSGVLAIGIAAALAATGLIAGIVWAVPSGGVIDAMKSIASTPWGAVTLIDLYVGFAITFGWMLVVEQRTWPRLGWLVLLLVAGNLATALFVVSRCRWATSVVDIFTARRA